LHARGIRPRFQWGPGHACTWGQLGFGKRPLISIRHSAKGILSARFHAGRGQFNLPVLIVLVGSGRRRRVIPGAGWFRPCSGLRPKHNPPEQLAMPELPEQLRLHSYSLRRRSLLRFHCLSFCLGCLLRRVSCCLFRGCGRLSQQLRLTRHQFPAGRRLLPGRLPECGRLLLPESAVQRHGKHLLC
jgi:hypothetical protein